jgi:hypothetical protein
MIVNTMIFRRFFELAMMLIVKTAWSPFCFSNLAEDDRAHHQQDHCAFRDISRRKSPASRKSTIRPVKAAQTQTRTAA